MSKLVPLFFLVTLIAALSGCDSPEERAQAYIESGKAHLASGETTLASLDFRNALQIDDKLVPAWYGLVEIEERQSNWEKVIGLLRKIIELDPSHLDAQIKYGKILLLAGQLDKALESSDTALKLDSTSAASQALRAAVLFKLDDPAGAVKFAKAALASDSGNIDALTVLVAERLTANDTRTALSYLDDGLKHNTKNVALHLIKIQTLDSIAKGKEAEAVFRHLVTLYPKRPEFRKALSRYLMRQNRLDDAETEIRALATDYPDDAEIQIDVVRFLNSTKGAAAATDELNTLIAGNPSIYRFQFALAHLQRNQGDADGAYETLKKIAQIETDKESRHTAKTQIAEALLNEKKLDEASRWLEEVLAADKRHLRALLLRAAIQIERRKLDPAIADLRAVLKDSPQTTRALILLARAHQLNGSIELADDRLANAFRVSSANTEVGLHYVRFLRQNSRLNRAEDVLVTVLARDPRDVRVLRTLAQVRLAQENWPGAQEVAEELAKISSEKATAHNILGRALEGQNKIDQSIEFFQRAHDTSPLTRRPIVSLVRAYVRSGRRDDAKRFLESVLETNALNVQALVLLARVQMLEKDGVEAAEALFKRALAEAPDDIFAYRELAQFFRAQERFDDAKSTIAAGLAKQSDSPSLRLILAGIYEQQGQIEQAIGEYESLHEKQPNSDIFANNLASLLSEYRNDKDSIQRAYTLAKRFRDSSVPHFKDTLGWIHYRLGEFERAKPLLKDAVKGQPNLPIFRYHLGMAHLAANEMDTGYKELRKALALSKKHPFPQRDKVREILASISTNSPTN